jgi:O-antigen/teichoic acid export membrane protein
MNGSGETAGLLCFLPRMDGRWRAALQSTAVSAVCRAVTIGLYLLQVRIGLDYMGAELFGFWASLGSVAVILGIADLGMGLGLQNRVSRAMGEGRIDDIPSLAVHAVKALTVVAGILILIGGAIAGFRIPSGIFNFSSGSSYASVELCFMIVVVGVAAAVPLGVPHRIAIGVQMGWLSAFGQVVSAILVFAVVVCAWKLNLDFLVFLVLAVAAGQSGSVAIAAVLIRKYRWRFSGNGSGGAGASGLTRHGLHFLFPQLGAVVVNQFPVIAISSVLGVAAVVPWVVSMRLLGMITQVHGLMIGPFWPAFSEAAASGDFRWIARTFQRVAAISVLFGVLMGALMTAFGQPVLEIVTGSAEGVPPTAVYLALVAWCVATVLMSAPVTLLNALDRLGVQSVCAVATILAVVVGTPWALGEFGLIGAAVLLAAVYSGILLPVSWAEALAALARMSGRQGRRIE